MIIDERMAAFIDSLDRGNPPFLNEIENTVDYNLWYCGHYHTDKKIDKMIFMFHKIEEFK